MSVHFRNWMGDIQAQVETALANHLPSPQHTPVRLHEAMRYVTLGGGKRVRPLLAHAAGEITGATTEALSVVSCAVEMIHVYSLVHDDMPCMDDDALRRGRPTCHVQYDEATALLVGDALQTEAFALISRTPVDDPLRLIELVRTLAHASGSRGMAGGQAIDLASVGKALNQPELELMHALKTGALIRAAILLGALCGKPMSTEERNALDHYAKRAGLLFQVVDDILDCTASTATLGKTAGKDAAADKPTYVSLLGLAGAREFAANLHAEAAASLEIFGSRASRLKDLTDFIAQREF